MKIRISILTLATSTSLATAVQAADTVIETATPYDWSGIYLGLQAGGAWLRADDSSDAVSMKSGAFGGYVGANWQNGNLVFGIEGDINYTSSDGDIYGIDTGADWQGAIRARLGYAIDNVLIYGAGGLAVTRAYIDAPPIVSEKETLTGWTIGAGAEYAFQQNWIARLDYRYSDYGGTNFGLAGAGEVDFTEHAVRVGIAYKF